MGKRNLFEKWSVNNEGRGQGPGRNPDLPYGRATAKGDPLADRKIDV